MTLNDLQTLQKCRKNLEANDTSFNWENIDFENSILHKMVRSLGNEFLDIDSLKILEKLYRILFT